MDELTIADLPELVALATRCHAADGGLPDAATEAFLARRYTGERVTATAVRDAGGVLVAASAVRPVDDGARGTALVAPDRRGQGLGARLLDRMLADGARLGAVTVETEALTPDAAALFAGRGLRQVFAEDVMCADLTAPASVTSAAGVALLPWDEGTADRFFTVYGAAFGDRPGFPGWSRGRWLDWTAGDEDFRPQWSLLATTADGRDVGFITCAEGWIVQVGVVPAARGTGLGSALVARALDRMRADGAERVLLDVNVDNPAGRLYPRLGFTVLGRRARFA